MQNATGFSLPLKLRIAMRSELRLRGYPALADVLFLRLSDRAFLQPVIKSVGDEAYVAHLAVAGQCYFLVVTDTHGTRFPTRSNFLVRCLDGRSENGALLCSVHSTSKP